MYYDLNVPWQPDTVGSLPQQLASLEKRRRCIIVLCIVGYHAVAINHRKCPFGKIEYVSGRTPLRQYTRLTLVLSDPQQNYGINAGNEVIRSYDLLAVQPETEKMFHSACTNLDIDIISLDMTVRLPFPVRAGYLRQALARGIVFELMYAPIIVDATARRNIIGNARTLQRLALKGDGLLVTSGAESVWSLRAPADVVNLTGLLGVPAHRRKNCLSQTAAATVMHAASRKFAHKSAITILPTETERKNTDMLDDFVEFK